MKVLVTGAAGFIGYHLCKALIKQQIEVVGLDNINDYYDVNLKFARLADLGISQDLATPFNTVVHSILEGERFSFVRMHLEDREQLPQLFEKEKFDIVCNLAAQAGVRYSIENPETYVDSNIVGFLNILECCRHHNIEHLVYASSSSVYGLNEKIPFSTTDNVDHPISMYAASKKSNELMAHVYSHLYQLPTTGLRFFTVYGPWGRPDMAIYLFTDAIANEKPIKVFNQGDLERDFTYIDDIVEGIVKVIFAKPKADEDALYNIYNIGNNDTVQLLSFIEEIEKCLGKKATKTFLPMQAGDVKRTWADTTALIEDFNYTPNTPVAKGIKKFVNWYLAYHT